MTGKLWTARCMPVQQRCWKRWKRRGCGSSSSLPPKQKALEEQVGHAGVRGFLALLGLEDSFARSKVRLALQYFEFMLWTPPGPFFMGIPSMTGRRWHKRPAAPACCWLRVTKAAPGKPPASPCWRAFSGMAARPASLTPPETKTRARLGLPAALLCLPSNASMNISPPQRASPKRNGSVGGMAARPGARLGQTDQANAKQTWNHQSGGEEKYFDKYQIKS